jgi:cobalamin biosynthesis protein CbiD
MLNKPLNENKERQGIDASNNGPARNRYARQQREGAHRQDSPADRGLDVRFVLTIGQRTAAGWSASKLAVATGLSRKTSEQILRLVKTAEPIECRR